MGEHVRMLGDGDAAFTKATGLGVETPGMGLRSKRFAMLVDDGVVRALDFDEKGQFGNTSAEHMLETISKLGPRKH